MAPAGPGDDPGNGLAPQPTRARPDGRVGVAARYLFAIRQLVENRAGGEADFKTLRTFLHDEVAVRRSDHSATRLQLASERLADKRRETSGEL